MRKTIGLLFVVCLILPGTRFSSRAQKGEGPYLDYLRRNVEKCKEAVVDAEIRMLNLNILIDAYPMGPDSTDEDFDRINKWVTELSRFSVTEYKFLCDKVKSEEGSLQWAESERYQPSPTPTPNAVPTPSPSTGAKDPTEEKLSKEEEEALKRLKEIIDRLGPLTTEINEWVKKQKAKPKPVNPPKGLETDMKWHQGLQTWSFNLPQGSISVNLPDNISAIGRISGTVIVEPTGQNETQRTQNQNALLNYAIELQIPEAGGGTSIVRVPVLTSNNTFRFVTPTDAGERSIMCHLLSGGVELSQGGSVLVSAPGNVGAGSLHSRSFQFPSLGQAGRALEIIGPFDGNFKTTEIRIAGQPARLLAESQNSCVVQAPDQNFGPTEITVKEGDVEAKGSCRNLGVRLAAPKTSLLKGETTVLTVTVEGLKGIQQNVPLLLQKQGVVSMAGGDTQTVQIRPTDVRADGTFELKRTLTGLQAGAFGVTATVIDPAHRPIIIPLTENAKVNGYRVKKEGNTLVWFAENVQHPVTGDPVNGEQRVKYVCEAGRPPNLQQLPHLGNVFLRKGYTTMMKTDCMTVLIGGVIILDE